MVLCHVSFWGFGILSGSGPKQKGSQRDNKG